MVDVRKAAGDTLEYHKVCFYTQLLLLPPSNQRGTLFFLVSQKKSHQLQTSHFAVIEMIYNHKIDLDVLDHKFQIFAFFLKFRAHSDSAT